MSENQTSDAPAIKLCSNCAYRENCMKKTSVLVTTEGVHCMEHAFDLTLMKKTKAGEK